MFTRIQSTGIGPHTDLDLALSPTGRTVIRGHSEHGKSVLIDAILLVLYGVTRGGEPFDAAQMSADRVSITLTSATGREFGYQRKTSPRWAYAYQGETLSQTSAKGWIDALSMARLPLWTGGPIRRDAIALCVEPLAWTRYAVSSPTESRKLRDMIVSTAGATADEAAKELYLKAGHTWTDEPMTEKAAAPIVTEANRALSAATGAAEHARAHLSGIEAGAPVEADTSAADGLPALEAAEGLWAAYDREVQRHGDQVADRIAERAAFDRQVVGWQATCQRLKEHDEAAVNAAKQAHKEAVTAWEAERDSRDGRYAADVAAAAKEHEAAVQARIDRMAARETEALRRHAAAERAAEEDYQRDVSGRLDRIAKLVAQYELDSDAHFVADAIEKADRKALAKWEARRAEQAATCATCGQSLPCIDLGPAPAVRVAGAPPVAPTMPSEPVRRTVPAYQAPAPEAEPTARTVAPLGPMRPEPVYTPPVPSPRPLEPVWTEPAPLVEPVAPTVERPASEAIRAAQAAVAARRTHATQLAGHERTMARLRETLSQAEAGQIRTQATADKAAAWLAAVRAAPGDVARRLEWLGKIGDNVTIELPNEGPAVVVKIDGRPWRLASRGRLVCADAHLRRAFATALGVPTLPIIVDDRQSWTGAIDVSGPVIELVTDPTADRITSIV